MADTKKHQYGSGELSFAQFRPNTQTPNLRLYFGNTTELSTTSEQESLDHWDTDHGLRVKDDSVVTQIDQSGSFITDNINFDNIAKFFLGTTATLTQASVPSHVETVTVDKFGTHQIGVTAARPTGFRKTTLTSAEVGASVLVAGVDYVMDNDRGTITFLEGGTVEIGDDVELTVAVAASSRQQSISGNQVIEGALHFKSFNPVGEKVDYFFPWVKITPNGDFNLKPGDEWVQLPFNIEVLKKGDLAAVYADGQAFTA